MMMRLGDMETDFEKEINGAFKFFDKNNDGMVSKEEEGVPPFESFFSDRRWSPSRELPPVSKTGSGNGS